MSEKKRNNVAKLLEYAGNYKGLTFLGLFLSAAAMVTGMLPYVCIWLVLKELIAVAPDWPQAADITRYGWMAFLSAFGSIIIYFFALMCTHLAAFRTAANIRKMGIAHLMKTPLGFFDNNASGYLRNRLDAGSADTETLLAHNLADIVGTIAMFLMTLILMLVFDWRMGFACLSAVVVSIGAMFTMMGGRNARLMAEYQTAQDVMSKAGTEYVRGIPVVKIFQQTVYSFKAFERAINDYSAKAQRYQGEICRVPQAVNLTATEGVFIFLVPVVLLIASGALSSGSFLQFVTNFAFYAVFSAVISTALARIMFAASGMIQADTAMMRIDTVMNAPVLDTENSREIPKGNSVEFRNVSFTYEGSDEPALENVSFRVDQGETLALVGPSGGGKTTAASLIPRFWDVSSGTVEVGGVDVRKIDPHVLMDKIAFVFQNNHLFKTSILENVKAARPEASLEEVKAALAAAQCDDIIAKLPDGIDTVIGSRGTYLSGGEQQRIILARAILKDSPIIVLDEATAFADPENEVLIQKAFRELTKDKTVIMIAHRLSTVVSADRIIVLENGHAVEEGTHRSLLEKKGRYADMWADYNEAISWRIRSGKEAK
ncbi:MAG: ABC transporter ATP-binding protein/permease [Erysipelotrichaceae bacterium]|nr:ABC transporter ATP-binding protein/permease [Erysipelotrichaceae bacterium]